ncbi:hypothetical protein CEXT_299571 [Caerostris extrusa]|uniref:Uncharacterized protein n=1 Tax=Caerostris extrusa TaxID=172846 RepID=A0AAV4M7C0_CAEEX|nr:hypothetical protein CEXT_299571 [Caerostris extrusa]
MQETLQHILPPLQDKCISSAQLLQLRHLMQLREDYTVFLNDINDMKRSSNASDSIHSSDRKILEYVQKNNDQLQDWVIKPRKKDVDCHPSISVNQKIKTNNSFATLSDHETEDELATNISTMAIQTTKQSVKQKPKQKPKQPAVTPRTNTLL